MWNVANLFLVISGNMDRETVAALHFTVQSFTPTQSERYDYICIIGSSSTSS